MMDEQRIRRFDIWIVTNGKSDKHLALSESEAREFERIYNQLTDDPARKVHVEHKMARIE